MRNEYALLIGALAQSVTGKPLQLQEPVNWNAFAKICRAHSVEPLVYDGLRAAGMLDSIPGEIGTWLRNAYYAAILRDTRFDVLKEKLAEELESAGVPHVFLKGACLKQDYPIPALRTMCDMDVLVYTKDYPALDLVAQKLGGTVTGGDGNHKNVSFPGELTVEFHPNLLHHGTPVGTEINPGWQYTVSETDAFGKELTQEGFYLNTICHLANHFVSGGVGVRFVLDVWVNRNLRRPQPDREFVERELRRFGLLEFARNIEALSDMWFATGEETDLLEQLGEYILTSGSHGHSSRAMLNAVTLSPGQSRVSALLKKAFFSRAELEDRFPWCKGKPLLLPIAWCTRAFRAVTKRGDLILEWSRGTGDVSKEEIEKQQKLLNSFGIDC